MRRRNASSDPDEIMARFFLEPKSWGENSTLLGDEAVHCARVLRAKIGDHIEVFDGAGHWCQAEITATSRSQIGLLLGETQHAPRPAVRVVLAQAVLKGKAMDWLIQKAVELGACEIQPLITDYTVVRPADAKEEKWQRAALEACKQCGQRYLPKVAKPMALRDYLTSERTGLKIVASLSEPRKRLREVIAEANETTEITFLVGPEGDLSATELDALIAAGFAPVDLGPQVLRSETAALFGLAAISYAVA